MTRKNLSPLHEGGGFSTDLTHYPHFFNAKDAKVSAKDAEKTVLCVLCVNFAVFAVECERTFWIAGLCTDNAGAAGQTV